MKFGFAEGGRLGVQYRPLRQTMKEHLEQLMADGLYSA
jgi:hypothetical protein